MSAEQLPEPPRNDEYARCLLAEHTSVDLEFVGDRERDIVTETEEFLYRHGHPYRHVAKKIGGFAFGFFISAGRAMAGMSSSEHLADTAPLDS